MDEGRYEVKQISEALDGTAIWSVWDHENDNWYLSAGEILRFYNLGIAAGVAAILEARTHE